MEVSVKPGKYILAVSGGVDSTVLLDLLSKKPKLELIAAHFNHGIRSNAVQDERFVREQAKQRGLSFEVGYGRLGKQASEEAARQARYDFLFSIQKKYHADAIITAHHQDDLIESAFINLVRGTGYKGLVAIKNNKSVLRPMLDKPKADIIRYAKTNRLQWVEDETNQDLAYTRNYLRNRVVNKLKPSQRIELLKNIDNVAKTDIKLTHQIANLSQIVKQDRNIKRYEFTSLPSKLGDELVAYWLREIQVDGVDSRTIKRVSLAIRTAKTNTKHEIKGSLKLTIAQRTAQFSNTL